jgi:cysteinyl-tRNA synthetase
MDWKSKLEFTNTMSGDKQQFVPLESGSVRIYSCGPTVYDYAHIGNFRNFTFVDVLRRTLKLFGYKVIHAMNITDIDDKIIRNAQKEGVAFSSIAQRYEKAFIEDCRYLKLEPMEFYPRATEHINEMVDLVKTLIEKGYTYEADGSIYYRISRFKEYGKLSRIDKEGLKAGARVDSDEYEKGDLRDFVLWKGYRDGEPSWETAIGKGRPGWHLECSAMSSKYLGKTFDIHTGAEDLIFPHHENEIAQSEAANEQLFVKYWLHCAFLNMKTEKMSKSKGNILTVHDLSRQGQDPSAIRYFLLSVHYRKPLAYSEEAIEASKAAVLRLRGFRQRIAEIIDAGQREDGAGLGDKIAKSREEFFRALADDLNTARALGAIFEMIREINPSIESQELRTSDARAVMEFLLEFNQIAAVFEDAAEMLPEEIEELVNQRQNARSSRDFALADKIRDELRAKGIVLDDTRDGVRWRKA